MLGPRVDPGSELGGHGNQRVWMSGVGVRSRRTTTMTECDQKTLPKSNSPDRALRVHRFIRACFGSVSKRRACIMEVPIPLVLTVANGETKQGIVIEEF